MNLTSLTIQNFRSITNAYKLPLTRATVIIGPNNEGKSNVLRALVLATRVLLQRRRPGTWRGSRYSSDIGWQPSYDWNRDFPLHLQEKRPQGESVFILEYELDQNEIDLFRSETGSRLNGTLPIRIALGKASPPKVTVYKKGPGSKTLSAKAKKIADFVSERIDLEYIPAVRTANSARQVVDALAARELAALEETEAFAAAMEEIAKLQEPILQELSKSIHGTLVQFLPSVKSVEVRVPSDRRYEAMRRFEIHIDDGSLTELKFKGDGAQSLAALALMRHASERSSLGKNVMVAIEEPESHLHPNAIHELKEVVDQLALKHQVVITTHCPLFVSRGHVSSNIIVNNRRARTAKSIGEIREILGVRAADNLRHAEYVLVVEGEDDRASMAALLRNSSKTIADALARNLLAIDSLGGAGKLVYKLGLLRDALCEVHCWLDDDSSGRSAYDSAREARLLSDAAINFARRVGADESEFEDLLTDTLVAGVLSTHYGIHNTKVPVRARKKKWSDRMQTLFVAAGKPWSKTTKTELKVRVSEAVAANPAGALDGNRRASFDALVSALEGLLSNGALA